jgi:Ca-activated chloride channel family protein
MQGEPVALRGVQVDGVLEERMAHITLRQRFANLESKPIEAVYLFPLDEGAAVCAFSARIGERVLEAKLEEREAAFALYDDAMAEGHAAFLLEQERPNIFTASLGNILPGQEIFLEVSYVSLLPVEGDAVRFVLPTTIAPRYAPASVASEDLARLDAPLSDAASYGLSLCLELRSTQRLTELSSPSHAIQVERGESTMVRNSEASLLMDRDFVLLMAFEGGLQPSARVVCDELGMHYAALSFVPRGLPAMPVQEVVFLLDCSGSMYGDSIAQARRALALCVRTLEEGTRFNVYKFGNTYSSLWPSSKAFGQASLDEASAFIEACNADLGGTEILAPLRAIVSENSSQHRVVLLLTDGQVANEDEVIALCAEHRGRQRVFAFGIGAGVSEHLVRGVARASGAVAEFIHPGERIEAKVLRMFRRLATPWVETRVDWNMRVEQAPAELPTVYDGEPLTIFARWEGASGGEAVLLAGEQSWRLPLMAQGESASSPVALLWARQRIRDLEEGKGLRRGSAQRAAVDRARQEIIAISKAFDLLSSFTSFVGVERRDAASASTEAAQLRRVPLHPVARSLGEGSSGLRSQAMAAPPMASRPRRMAAAPAPAPMAMAPAARAFSMAAPGGAPPGAPASAPRSRSAEASAVAKQMVARRPSSQDLLYAILMLQQADGRFGSGELLRELFAGQWAKLEALFETFDEARVLTAAVLQLLEHKWGASRDEWEAAALKAQRYLERQGAAPLELTMLDWSALGD